MMINEPKFQDFTFAFQPIVNVIEGSIISFEALVRGVNNESALEVLQRVAEADLHHFDEALRLAAIPLAAKLGIGCSLNLNLMPRSLELSSSAIRSTLEMAKQCGIEPERITLEITEREIIRDFNKFIEAINNFRNSGLKISIDDFGAGYSGLNLLADFQPDTIKLDMSLVRNVDKRGPRQAIVRGINRTCRDLGIEIVAEGVETVEEYWWCCEEEIEIFQGYLFARPGFEHLPLAFYPQIPS